jgi:protein-L-isoaspartate(D-aspartate) O-methyltransferase
MQTNGYDRLDDMVEKQLVERGIRQDQVLQAFREVDRADFVPDDQTSRAYADRPLPIGHGQTISQPYIVALMTEAADLSPDDRVLEIGTGSGYQAAILAQICDHVYSIERHSELTEQAKQNLNTAGIDNVECKTGDGTRGWPGAAPFDAILVTASGPQIPDPLKDQLAIGGHMIIPVGIKHGQQKLIRITKTAEDKFEREELSAVAFVPLIGEYGHDAEGGRLGKLNEHTGQGEQDLCARLTNLANPLPSIEDPEFGQCIDRYGDRRIVALGESTHGTSEFYRARAEISERLIHDHDFNIIALEADWPDAAAIDHYIRHQPVPDVLSDPFKRFPTWMWRNLEFHDFIQTLRQMNAQRDADNQIRIIGLDLYSLNRSMHAVLDYLNKVDEDAAAIAEGRFSCLTRFAEDPTDYARSVAFDQYKSCQPAVEKTLNDLLDKRMEYMKRLNGEEYFQAVQNARLADQAESYYRNLYEGASTTWNLRDRHMADTLQASLDHFGDDSKAIIWAHNSHLGDARATEMGNVRGQHNLGQLIRQDFGADQVALIGLMTESGTVAAADTWNGPMEIKTLRPAHDESHEQMMRDVDQRNFFLDLTVADLPDDLSNDYLQRAVGVIYRPFSERASHLFSARLADQFDGLIWFDQTNAVMPLSTETVDHMPDTYPFGL